MAQPEHTTIIEGAQLPTVTPSAPAQLPPPTLAQTPVHTTAQATSQAATQATAAPGGPMLPADATPTTLPEPVASGASDIGLALGPGAFADTTSLVQLSLSLLVVIGLIVGISWLLRRMQSLPGRGGDQMRILATLAVGTRERILMIDAAGTRLLVALAPGAIRTLHVFSPDSELTPAAGNQTTEPTATAQGPFGALLQSLNRAPDQEQT